MHLYIKIFPDPSAGRELCPTRKTSGVATWGGGYVGQSATPDNEKIAKIREKEGKNQEKSGKKEESREGSFTLPLLTDRAGYATA